jgi:uncharacterized damage-inducible protein DinB
VKAVPPLQAASDLLLPLGEIHDHLIALAKAIPEEKYGWRPGEGVRSVKEVLLHIAFGNQLLLNVVGNTPKDALVKQIESNAKAESAPKSKAEIIALLEETFTAVRKELEGARNAGLNRAVDYFGTATTRRGVLASIDTHIAEHYGQLIAYARMNGIVPPWSK